ncbi:MAG: hypothetical protein ACE5J4_02905 [Candidatus Aenigmatarchaeota archaeon]
MIIENLRKHGRLFKKGHLYSDTKVLVIERKYLDNYSFENIPLEISDYVMRSKNALFVIDVEKNIVDKIFSPTLLPDEMRKVCDINQNFPVKVRDYLSCISQENLEIILKVLGRKSPYEGIYA